MAKKTNKTETNAPKFNEAALVPFGHKKGRSIANFLNQFGYDKKNGTMADFCRSHWGIEIEK